jgi:Leucine-rich repeat (LRR) protein
MKSKIWLALFVLPLILSCSSDDSPPPPVENPDDGPGFEITTAIPDAVFEQALVTLDLDDKVDGTVVTSKILGIKDLILNDLGIADLTGIEDFQDLENLVVSDNLLTRLDVSNNTKLKFVYAENNELTFVNVQDLSFLEKIAVEGNKLFSLDSSSNPALQLLTLSDNDVEIADVSANASLTTFSIENNPLTCIKVSASQFGNIPANWSKDAGAIYSVDCN